MLAKPPKDEDKHEIYYTHSRVEKLTNIIFLLLLVVLIDVPIWLLYDQVQDGGSNRAYMLCIMIVMVFTLVFSGILALLTSAKRHETFAASAAYCAVLVVFFGNIEPNRDSR